MKAEVFIGCCVKKKKTKKKRKNSPKNIWNN